MANNISLHDLSLFSANNYPPPHYSCKLSYRLVIHDGIFTTPSKLQSLKQTQTPI